MEGGGGGRVSDERRCSDRVYAVATISHCPIAARAIVRRLDHLTRRSGPTARRPAFFKARRGVPGRKEVRIVTTSPHHVRERDGGGVFVCLSGRGERRADKTSRGENW